MQRAFASDRASADFALQLGVALEHLGNTDDARAHYREAVNRDGVHREANFLLARSLMAIGRHREAIERLKKTIEPNDRMTPQFLSVLATAYAEVGEINLAFETLQHAKMLASSQGNELLANTLENQARKLRESLRKPALQ